MTEHTPIPWKVVQAKRGHLGDPPHKMKPFTLITTDFRTTGKIVNGPEADICEIAVGDSACCANTGFDHRINQDEADANAAFIVRAVNAHEALLSACNEVASVLRLRDQDAFWESRLLGIVTTAIDAAKGGDPDHSG